MVLKLEYLPQPQAETPAALLRTAMPPQKCQVRIRMIFNKQHIKLVSFGFYRIDILIQRLKISDADRRKSGAPEPMGAGWH